MESRSQERQSVLSLAKDIFNCRRRYHAKFMLLAIHYRWLARLSNGLCALNKTFRSEVEQRAQGVRHFPRVAGCEMFAIRIADPDPVRLDEHTSLMID